MFEIGWTELLVIAVVAILVVGPKELPSLLRTLGQYAGKMRSMARDFQRQFEEAARDTGLDDVRKTITSTRDAASPTKHLKEAFSPIAEEAKGLKKAVEAPSLQPDAKAADTADAGAGGSHPAGPAADQAGTAEKKASVAAAGAPAVEPAGAAATTAGARRGAKPAATES